MDPGRGNSFSVILSSEEGQSDWAQIAVRTFLQTRESHPNRFIVRGENMPPMKGIIRGALVFKTNQQTINNAGYVEFEGDEANYNYTGIHDSTTNNSRLTVPRGVRRVRLTANLCLANAPDFYRVEIHKNRMTANGLPSVDIPISPDVRTRINLISAPLVVMPGDYFEVYVATNATGIIVDSTWHDSWFVLEVLA